MNHLKENKFYEKLCCSLLKWERRIVTLETRIQKKTKKKKKKKKKRKRNQDKNIWSPAGYRALSQVLKGNKYKLDIFPVFMVLRFGRGNKHDKTTV